MAKKSFNLVNTVKVVSPYSNVDYNYGPYNTVEDAVFAIPSVIREKGLTVGVLLDGNVIEYWWKSGIQDSDLVIKSSNAGTIPIYENVDDVPPTGDTTIPTNVLLVDDAFTPFTFDEEKEMMMQAIYELQKEVSLMKRSFTDHMDCGTFEDSKMIIEGNNPEVEAEEPLWASETGEPFPVLTGDTFPDAEPEDPNILKIRHLTIKSGTLTDLETIMNYLLPDEMVWAYDVRRLYIKQRDGSLYWLNSMGGDIVITGNTTGSTIDMSNLESITFITPNNNKYTMKVSDSGETKVINQKTEIPPDFGKVVADGTYAGYSSDTSTTYLQKLYINSIYCGGIDGESPDKYQPCSHNFVELSNLTNNDIGLNNLVLRYGMVGESWKTLRLEGVIKSKSTFLVRGAPCSVMEANTTRIKVSEYDMEWKDDDDNGGLIRFSNVRCKFLLEYMGTGTTNSRTVPYLHVGSVAYATPTYIDMVGMNKVGAITQNETIDAFEKNRFQQMVPSSRLYQKYFAMDPVKQATKVIGTRDNNDDWIWIELNKNLQPNIESYTPKASYQNKNLFFDKTKLDDGTPNMITVTFGLNAHTTRCFNWISVGYHDEYLWYRVSGATEWTQIESFKSGDDRIEHISRYYNRIRVVATDKTPYTAHKVILSPLSPNTYEYKCGRVGFESDVRKFKVVAESTGDFSFVQTTDQQAFNWSEYQVWTKAANFIKDNENPTFIVNTGDMTQNGNRINEWLDYYNGGERLFDGSPTISGETFNGVEQMSIIGNNDLCPADFESFNDGEDMSKINSINFLFFYTYEIDVTNPPIMVLNGVDYYIPSLYSFDYNNCHFLMVNTEMPMDAQDKLYKKMSVYAFMKNWCENDLSKTTKKWKIAAAHEMPFTIIDKKLIDKYKSEPETQRGGSRINTAVADINDRYWFSRMLEKHNVRLCIGGHKHTYSCSYPIRENVVTGATGTTFYSMKPIIQVLNSVYESYKTIFDDKESTQLCKIEKVDAITAPVYAMCQATGYKQTSNKELPAVDIPWLENYFPASFASGSAVANDNQKYPFYIKWTVTDTQIIGDVWRINNIMIGNTGKFNINTQVTEPPFKENANGTSNSQIIINYY